MALVLLPALLAAGLAVILAAQQTVRYQASASFTLSDPASGTQVIAGEAFADTRTPDERVAEVLRAFSRPQLLEETSRLLGGRLSPQGVKAAISVSPQGINGVVAVSARAEDARLAAQLANAAVRAESVLGANVLRASYRRAADTAQAQLRAGRAGGLDRITLLQRQQNVLALRSLARAATPVTLTAAATIPRSPVAPRPVRDALVAAALGLLLGGLLVLTRARLVAAADAHRVGAPGSQEPPLGRIPSRLLGAVVRADDPTIDVDDRETFRIVRTNVEFLRPEPPIRSVSVSGVRADAGASGVAASLAFASAASGRRTLLVDADLHHSALADRLGAASGPGLADVLLGCSALEHTVQDLSWGSATRPSRSGSLWFVPAGNARGEAIARFSGDGLELLLAGLTEAYDFLVLDTPPVPATAESLVACAASDAVLLCLRLGRDRLEDVEDVERTLERLGCGQVGHVLTDDRTQR